ncbi:MAG TPA: septum formation initiator family protein [bacterium]|nr:septum formation initiator family protein [bacterium]
MTWLAIALTKRSRTVKRSAGWQWRRKGGRKWGALLLVGLLLYFGYFSWGQIKLMLELKRKISKVEQETVAAQQQFQELEAEIDYLKSDSYIEKVARQELGLVKPGEIIFMPENPSGWRN